MQASHPADAQAASLLPVHSTRTIHIGPYELPSVAVLAPMAGVTDRPFRILCRQLGAGLAASEMLTSNTRLWSTPKSRLRMSHEGEPEPRVVQLAGADPHELAEAARINVDLGAQIIDLNMGCPAKKVCGKLCGSALLQDEPLVSRILEAVVSAVSVPVTLKIRTGWDREHRNAVAIARIAMPSTRRSATSNP
jgi:tRNA-dihydrouridine synthase B